jgi:hypothetical protein
VSAGGYVVVLRGDRVYDFEGALLWNGKFGEPVPDFSHRSGTPLVCFLSASPGRITHIADGKVGVRAGTNRKRLNLSDIEQLATPIRSSAILKRVDAKVRRHVQQRLRAGGLLPPKSFEDFIAAVIALAPDSQGRLLRYTAERQREIARLPEGVRRAFAAQKEAVNTALGIAGIDRSALLRWAPTGEQKSLLDGLMEVRVREDQMIYNDLLVPFQGFAALRPSIVGAARFESDDVRLEVLVANRTPLEMQTGADLIYFNATYESFVFVQYKVMEKERDSDGVPQSIYRLPNAQLAAEIGRMNALHTRIESAGEPTNRHGFRLHDSPFFLKLCPRLVFNPDDVSLTPGMYFPLEQWRFIEKDSDLVGARGGRVVSYGNVGRYLDNTGFSGLVRDAWIGTTPQQAAISGPLIQTVMSEGKALVLAVKQDKRKR